MKFLKEFIRVYGSMIIKLIECVLIVVKLALEVALDIATDTKKILIRLTK